MAVGDIVSVKTGTVLNTWHYYQPAAGVEIIVLSAFAGDGLQYSSLYDGVDNMYSRVGSGLVSSPNNLNIKIGINNSIYLGQYSDATATSFSGIQIK